MSDPDGKRPRSSAERTSLVDSGWSDVPPPASDSTVELSQTQLAELVHSNVPDQPRELPRYESSSDDAEEGDDDAIQEDATKRIAYAALLGGAQAGRGGPRRSLSRPITPDSEARVHEQPTLVRHEPLTEEEARELAGVAPLSGPVATPVVPAPSAYEEPPLPSFAEEVESQLGALEFGGASEEPTRARLPSFAEEVESQLGALEFGGTSEEPTRARLSSQPLNLLQPEVASQEPTRARLSSQPLNLLQPEEASEEPARPRMPSDPLPQLGFDDSDLTVRAVVKMPPEMFRDQDGTPGTPALPIVEEIKPKPAAAPTPTTASRPPPPPRASRPPPAPRASTPPPRASTPPPRASTPPPRASTPPPAPSERRRLQAQAVSAFAAAESERTSSPPQLVSPVAESAAQALRVAAARTGPGLAAAQLPNLFGALGQPFRVLGVQLPLWSLWLIPTALAGFAVVLSVLKAHPQATIAQPAPVTESARPAAGATASLQERAAQGERAAMQQLSARPEAERSVADAVALAKGKRITALGNLSRLEQKLLSNPSLLEQPTTQQSLLSFVADERTAPDALAAISELPGPLGPDLLYEVWTGTKKTTETTQLARELLHKPVVLAKGSEALKVAVDLRADLSCEQVRGILPRAKAAGDWRALHLLGRLVSRHGCGSEERDDCFSCLRNEADERSIKRAIKAVRSRPRPKL